MQITVRITDFNGNGVLQLWTKLHWLPDFNGNCEQGRGKWGEGEGGKVGRERETYRRPIDTAPLRKTGVSGTALIRCGCPASKQNNLLPVGICALGKAQFLSISGKIRV